MPTPASGTISMNDMRTHINRATSSSIDMAEMRDRYGGSGSISFTDLYDCEGFTVDPVQYIAKGIDIEGFDTRLYGFGSISPNESSGVQVAANSYIYASYANTGAFSAASLSLTDAATGFTSDGITAGYQAADITRIVTANTSRTLGSSSGTSVRYYTYDWPSTGTVHCLVKF